MSQLINALNSALADINSALASVATPTLSPTGLTLLVQPGLGIQATFVPVPGTDYTKLYRSTVPIVPDMFNGAPPLTYVGATPANMITDYLHFGPNLPVVGTVYYYAVAAVNSVGTEGPLSAFVPGTFS